MVIIGVENCINIKKKKKQNQEIYFIIKKFATIFRKISGIQANSDRKN